MKNHHHHDHATRTTLIIVAAIVIIIIGGLYFWRKSQGKGALTCTTICTTNMDEEKDCTDICTRQ